MAITKKKKPRASAQHTQEKPNYGKKGARGQAEGIRAKKDSGTKAAATTKKKPGSVKQKAKTRQAAKTPVRRRK